MRLLVLDNYDSFTYNLVHLVENTSDISFDVVKNDQITLDEVSVYDKILLSPGPGIPSEAGILIDLLREFHKTKSILGVCLGLQAIGEVFDCPLKNLERVYHGIATSINIVSEDLLFKNCPSRFEVGRYHSWVIDEKKINDKLHVTATDEKGLIMAARHREFDVRGVQFHPESILSEHGALILKNWLSS